jgi:hypothetical protein
MWWLALASIVAAPSAPPHQPPVFERQATATVRIVNAAKVKLGEQATDRHDWIVPATKTRFRHADGSFRPARLVEFP